LTISSNIESALEASQPQFAPQYGKRMCNWDTDVTVQTKQARHQMSFLRGGTVSRLYASWRRHKLDVLPPTARFGKSTFYGGDVKKFLRRACMRLGRTEEEAVSERGRRAISMFRSICALAAVLALLALPECSNMALPKEEVPTATPDPTYGSLVTTRLKNTFSTLSPNDTIEISQPHWVHNLSGWSWLVCVHFQDKSRRRTYALFMLGNAIIESRYSVETDMCEAQPYSSLDLASGTIRPRGTGGPGPIY